MKRILCIFGALALLLSSCSSDEKSSPVEIDSTLPKTISYIYPSPQLGTNNKNTASYNGNKLISLVSEDSKKVFTYEGDVIVKQEVFDVDGNGKELKSAEVSYTYENGKLKTKVTREDFTVEYPNGYYIDKVVFTHTSNEVISYVNYSVNKDTKAETKNSEGKLTYKDENLVKDEQKFSAVTETWVYEYDTKNNPLKNILGFNLLLNEIDGFAKNNVVKTTKTSSEFPNAAVYATSYLYNNNNYPTRNTSFDGGGKNIEFEIEYTY